MKPQGQWVRRVLFGALFAAVPVAAHASDARIEGLGVDAIYLDDYETYRLFPTVFARTNNLAAASLGNSGTVDQDNSFGVIASGNKESYGTFAVFLRGRSPFLDGMRSMGDDLSPDINVPSQQFDLGWAKQFETLAVGLRFEHARSSYSVGNDEKSPATSPGFNNWNTTAFHGGVKIDGGEANFLEIGGEVRLLSYKDTIVDVMDDAGLSFRGSARYWMKCNDKVDFVPAASYYHIDTSREGDSIDRTINGINAGGAFEFAVNQDNLLILGASFSHVKNNATDTSRTMLPNLFGALEWDIKSWLTGRVGAQQAMVMSSDGDTFDFTDSSFRYGLGVGIHFNNFDVDATLNEDFPFTGGYFISGDETSGNMFGRVTGSYYF